MGEKGAHRQWLDIPGLDVLRRLAEIVDRQELEEAQQIPFVGAYGVGREAALVGQMVEISDG